jgi:hypothetical protein
MRTESRTESPFLEPGTRIIITIRMTSIFGTVQLDVTIEGSWVDARAVSIVGFRSAKD